MRKTVFVMIAALATIGCSASGDSTLVLKPTAAQLQAAKPASNRICPVSGDSIGAMGEGVRVIWKGQVVNLCCPGCLKTFEKDPAKYTAIALDGIR